MGVEFLMKPRGIINLGNVVLSGVMRRGNTVFDRQVHLEKVMQWLCRAQDSTPDDGVSEGYHLYHGWLPSYPETTGYIIETFFDYHRLTNDDSFKARAKLMADWLISTQNLDGSIPDSYFRNKMVFDTGQVIFGLVRTYEETGFEKYREVAVLAGEWLVAVQAQNGSWVKHAVNDIPHSYYSRVAWSLLRLHSVTQLQKFLDAAVRNIEWAIQQQRASGWFDNASFSPDEHSTPVTHTIAYTIRGILECGLYLDEARFVNSARQAVDGLAAHLPDNGRVAGTYDANWHGDDSYSCLTGDAQLAIIMYKLYQQKRDDRYLTAANRITEYLKGKHELHSDNPDLHGAIAGSDPIWGKYIHFCYPNWAAKFFAESLITADGVTQPA